MAQFLRLWFGTLVRIVSSRQNLLLENLALRQQLAVFKRRHPKPRLTPLDKLFWIAMHKFWPGWMHPLKIVTPESVSRWHREGFRLYWACLSRHRIPNRRKHINKELRDLIFRMVAENPTWGAPRIHGELLILGFDVSERTVSRWVQRAPKDPKQTDRWKAFLKNHREIIAAMDFFTVPTLTFGTLYCFFVISHDRRRILHFNVTKHPGSDWVVQQLREAFPFENSHKYLIFDRDKKFGWNVTTMVKSIGCAPKRTAFRSPWQNGVAERWVESCRRDLLDHVIVLNERHLKRLLSEYICYYHEDRTHLGLNKETPLRRPITTANANSRVVSRPRLGGLHHRYDRAAA